MRDERAIDRALARLLRPRLGYLPSRWPEALYLHVREQALATGQSEVDYVDAVIAAREPDRVARLIDAATIGHTAAYRHPEQFERLRVVRKSRSRGGSSGSPRNCSRTAISSYLPRRASCRCPRA